MKKAKLTFALVVSLVATAGLSACDWATYNEGVVLSYKDATGNRVDYTAAQLLGSYESDSSANSTIFDKVYELLIRNYYNDASQATVLTSINREAQNQVNDLKKKAEENATSNSTSYEKEFETILSNNSCKNADELFDLKQYTIEKDKFEKAFYDDNIDAMRDGVDADGNDFFPASATYGEGDSGYLKEKMPYHVRHILVKVGAASGELTQAEITADNAKSLATTIKELAGSDSTTASRMTFGEISAQVAGDSSSTSAGDLGIMDTAMSYVNEFKLGIYAYDTIYNKTSNTYRDANKDSLLPPDDTEIVVDGNGTKESIKAYLTSDVDKEAGTDGIGQIPYGAAVALASSADQDGGSLGYKVNDGSATFYPRNVLFNKYFNKHNVCVITPNEINYNDPSIVSGTVAGDSVSETNVSYTGAYKAEYGALAGFATDTTGVLPQFTHNVLTDTEGQIVLAVRAGTSGDNSYQGVHFIVIQRSALNEYGTESNGLTERTAEDTAGATSTLSDYYTTSYPTADKYPTYTVGDETKDKITYVNFLKQETSSYKQRAETVLSKVKGYNDSINTYIFQKLVESNSITFANNEIGNKLASYIKLKREKASYDLDTTWTKTWKEYAEYLVQQDYLRYSNTDGKGRLISETCAIGYTSAEAKNQTGVWAKGGACYGK